MSSALSFSSWILIPISWDEGVEEEYYHALETEYFGDYVNILVNVEHQVYRIQTQQQQTPSITNVGWFSSVRSMFLPSQAFQENGLSYMQMFFSDLIMHQEFIDSILPIMTTSIRDVIQNSRLRLFTFGLVITIPYFYEESDNDILNRITMNPMGEVGMVPASEIAIESLVKKVKLEDYAVVENCSICLTEFEHGIELSSMPCNHVYHEDCLIQWLRTSHVCPLCRYPLPTSNTE